MKRIKLLMPLAVVSTAITPVAMLTSCGNANITIENKTVNSGDSLAAYKFKMAKIPSDKKVTVNVINKSETQEPVAIYRPYNSTNNQSNEYLTLDLDVANDGTVVVPAGYYLAPSQSASSEFGLRFDYKDGDKTVSETVDGLKFNYTIDYGAELKDGDYPAVENAPDASHWTDGFNTVYSKDILNDSNIFQNDARYTTSKRIKAASEFKDLDSFKAYFNDIVKQDDGIHVHMNYEIKGMKDTSQFKFIQYHEDGEHKTTYVFEKFDFSFTFETHDGYQLTSDTASTGVYKEFNIADNSTGEKYKLDGRFKGSFKYSKQTDEQTPETGEVKNFDNLIDNYTIFTSNEKDTEAQICGMLAFGVIHLTYGFSWTDPTPKLTMFSTYAKNA